jgi:hypothetical protein
MIVLSSFAVIALALVIVFALAAVAWAPNPLDLTEDLTARKAQWPSALRGRPSKLTGNHPADRLLPMVAAAGLQ